ncbi:MAG: carboxypeptidase-like regulatory domain-containing protein [archaeon]
MAKKEQAKVQLGKDLEETQTNSAKENFFSKLYHGMEDKYFAMCDWLSAKGLNINALNDSLEEKGIPAFALIGSIFLIILLLAIYFIFFGLNKGVNTTFGVTDYLGMGLSNTSLTITDNESGKTIFSDKVDDQDVKKLKLKIGKEYTVSALKDGYTDFSNTITINSKEEIIKIQFDEISEFVYLTIRAIDRENQKLIPNAQANYSYSLSGKSQEKGPIEADLSGNIQLYVPKNKDISVTVIADGYENASSTYKLTSGNETKDIPMDFTTASLEAATSNVTFNVSNSAGQPIEGAEITVYDLTGNIVGTSTTELGKALINLPNGQNLRFTISKENYQNYDSSASAFSFRPVKGEETINVTLEDGGKIIRAIVLDSSSNTPINEASISLFNNLGDKVTSVVTSQDGSAKFSGLDAVSEYIVTACHDNYFCDQKILDPAISNVEFKLENIDNTLSKKAMLSVWVVDSSALPVTSAKVNLFIIKDSRNIPYGTEALSVDLTGYVKIPVIVGQEFLISSSLKDQTASETITIGSEENKVILVLDVLSRDITVELKDVNGSLIIDGHLLIKSKTGEVIFDKDINSSEPLVFNNYGYKDLILEYTSLSGEKTTMPFSVGKDNKLSLTINPSVYGSYPIINYLGLETIDGEISKFITQGKDYYLLFDLVLPVSATNVAVYVRAGSDEQTDSIDMSYGIVGYSADTVNFLYGTTYNKEPLPGNQEGDLLNIGSTDQLNKWIKLDFKGSNNSAIGNKKIKIKVRADNVTEQKLNFFYRAEINNSSDKLVYRDPIDPILKNNNTSNERQNFYSESKKLEINLFETPANCSENFCASYRFLDSDYFDYDRTKFNATKDSIYALEITLFSLKNINDISATIATSKLNPAISLISFSDISEFPTQERDYSAFSDLELNYKPIVVNAGEAKKLYAFFYTKTTGVSYLDMDLTSSSFSPIKEKFSFNIYAKKDMTVKFTPSNYLALGEKLQIQLNDKETGKAIENAFIKFSSSNYEFLDSIKGGENLNGKGGLYIFDRSLSANKIIIDISAPLFRPYSREMIIADNKLISVLPNKVTLNIGENQTSDSTSITLKNLSKETLSAINYSINYIIPVDGLSLSLNTPSEITGGASSKIDITVDSPKDSNFTQSKAYILITGFIGNTQVAKEIEVIINKGRITQNCLLIKPATIETYVGKDKDSIKSEIIKLKNTCNKDIVLAPEILEIKSDTKELFEFTAPDVKILADEEKEYEFSIKNLDERESSKAYKFEINWINAYYNLNTTKLNVTIVDLSKALQVIPSPIVVPMASVQDSYPATTYFAFGIKNIGSLAIKDIQISKASEAISSNIGDNIQPVSIEILKPNQTVPVKVTYNVSAKNATLDDMYYTVSGVVPGLKNRVEAKVKVYFWISQSGCLEIDPKNLIYDFPKGKFQEKNFTVTNTCAEPVLFTGQIDKRNNLYNQAFGNNKIEITPLSGSPLLLRGQKINVSMKISGDNYFNNAGVPIKFIGRTTSGLTVSSSSVLLSLAIGMEDETKKEDYLKISNLEIPICGSNDAIKNIEFPIISEDCSDNGYCDALSASNYIIEKIDELNKKIISTSSQFQNKVQASSCSRIKAKEGYCALSELGGDTKPITFSLYLQNDRLTTDLFKDSLRKSTSGLKDYMVEVNPGKMSPEGVYVVGKKIHFKNLEGCGKYRINIDGFVATTYDDIIPSKVYYYVNIVDYNKTEQCNKNIENFLNYLPKDKDIKRTANLGTWLTVVSGDKSIGEGVSKDIFNDITRYSNISSSANTNKLKVSIGKITEDSNAIAKIMFRDKLTPITNKPEEVDIIVNSSYSLSKGTLPSVLSDKAIDVVSRIVSKQDLSEVCISRNNDYLLVMSFVDISSGSLLLDPKESEATLNTGEICKDFTIKSAIVENVIITSKSPEGLNTKFKYNSTTSEKLNIELENINTDYKFETCF